MKALLNAGLAGALSWLSACSSVPPAIPDPPALPAAYPQAEDGNRAQPAARWWETLHDEVLDQLIATAQASNHEVRIALARVAEARAALPAVDSRRAPEVDLAGALSDARSGLPAAVKFGRPDTRAAQLDLQLGWELDLMGAAAAGSQAARADLRASQWAVRGAQLMVADEVARQYLMLQSLDRGEALAQAVVDSYDLSVRLLQARQREGIASELELQRLALERAGAAARLPAFAADRAAVIDRLALLMGLPPGSVPGLPPRVPAPALDPEQPQALLAAGHGLLADPGSLPVGQPADLLLRRPDLQAAASVAVAELQRQAQAHAERYPRLFLSALFGGERLTLNSVAYAPARFSNAALAFTAPLFDAGRREALEALQGARAGAARLAWEQAVLRAVQEVDSGLAQFAGQRARCIALLQARERALAALLQVRALQREGESDALAVFDLLRSTLLAQAALLDAERDRGAAAIQLYAALGGAWADPTAAAPQ